MCIHFKKEENQEKSSSNSGKSGRLIIQVVGESFTKFWWTNSGTTALATCRGTQNNYQYIGGDAQVFVSINVYRDPGEDRLITTG